MSSAGAGEVLLEARDLTYGYVSGRPVLRGWSGSFRAGTMTALTGQSGRGKSTLLYLLGLVLRPDTGSVRLHDIDTAGLPDASRARMRAGHLGFVFQDAALDATRTVLENVTETALYRHQSRKSARERALELLKQFDVDVPPDRKPGQVSGGQAQRIALCRALLYRPQVLLADEPTGNLDPTTSDLVVRAMRSHAESGAAVIVVTHSPEVARACDTELRI